MKYTLEQRLDIGRRIYEGELTRFQAAEEYGINDNISLWGLTPRVARTCSFIAFHLIFCIFELAPLQLLQLFFYTVLRTYH